jgi:hypothetical protein
MEKEKKWKKSSASVQSSFQMSRRKAADSDDDCDGFAEEEDDSPSNDLFASSSASSSSPSPVKSSASDILMEQSVNGSFALSPRVASLLGTTVDLLRDILANLQLVGGETEKVIATAAVLVYLEKRCGDQRDLWDLSATKAKRFIEKQATSKPLSDILQAVAAIF